MLCLLAWFTTSRSCALFQLLFHQYKKEKKVDSSSTSTAAAAAAAFVCLEPRRCHVVRLSGIRRKKTIEQNWSDTVQQYRRFLKIDLVTRCCGVSARKRPMPSSADYYFCREYANFVAVRLLFFLSFQRGLYKASWGGSKHVLSFFYHQYITQQCWSAYLATGRAVVWLFFCLRCISDERICSWQHKGLLSIPALTGSEIRHSRCRNNNNNSGDDIMMRMWNASFSTSLITMQLAWQGVLIIWGRSLWLFKLFNEDNKNKRNCGNSFTTFYRGSRRWSRGQRAEDKCAAIYYAS